MARAWARSGRDVAAGDGTPEVRVLGGFGLRVDGEERGTDVPVRARALLAYLALRPGLGVERQRLAFLMWPESSDGQARTNLRNVLHHLRRTWPDLEAVIDVTPASLRWIDGSNCRVDVGRFLGALEAAAHADEGTPERVAALRAAVDAYTGDLLEGIYEEWLDDERGRLRDRYVASVRELVETWIDAGSPAEAIGAARELVRREPLAEDHHRLLIRAHAAAGDRAGAVRAFHECAAVLRQDLGVDPSAATVAAYQRLVDDAWAAASPARPPMPAAGITPLVGRRHERQVLLATWCDVTETASARLVLVTGEAGIGKTRLLEELVAECARRGAVVAKARSYLGEGELGYGVVTDWLRTPEVASTLSRCSRADRAELSRVVPDLAGPVGDSTAAPVDEVDRTRLFAAAARALALTNRPVLLVADDAHWADQPSLHLLHYLVRSLATPVLVAATARRESLDEDHPLSAVVRSLQAIDRAAVVDLERLTERETGELATALGVPPLDTQALGTLHRETEGNPLFVVEAVRAGWDARTADIGLSPKLQALITGRLAHLSTQTRTVLGMAATVGRAFTADLVREATGLDELTVVRALDELWRRGIVEGHEPDGYDFSHGKIREAAYAALSPAVRTRNHLRVAETLEVTARDKAAVSGLIASHFDQAGRADRAVEWYREAAAQAIRLASHVEAVRLLDRARSLVAALPQEQSLRSELALLSMLPAALGGVEGFASDRLDGVQQRAEKVAARLGTELDPAMMRSLVMTSLCRDEFDEARAAAERLLRAGLNAHDASLELEACYLLGITSFWSGMLEDAAAQFEQVVARFDPERHPEHVVRFGHDPRAVCVSRLGNTLWLLGRSEEAAAARDRGMALADEINEILTLRTVRLFAALLCLDLDDADTYRRIVLALDSGGPHSAHAVKALALRGYLDVLEGRAAAGIASIETAFRRCGDRNLAPGFRMTLLRVLVAAHAVDGEPAAGVAAADRAMSLGGTPLWSPEVRRLRATFLHRLGSPTAEVAAELDRATAAAAAIGAHGPAVKIDATRRRIVAS